jgi:hypothetical protein
MAENNIKDLSSLAELLFPVLQAPKILLIYLCSITIRLNPIL